VKVIDALGDWEAQLRREHPGVALTESDRHPPGIDAVTGGVLVGRYYSMRQPPYGVIFDQPRSCGGRI
jgi:hypothetical protein